MNPVTMPELLARAASRWPESPALVFDVSGASLSYAQLATAVRRTARGLRNLGVRHGDRVAVMLPNEPEFPVSWLALLEIGAVLVPINVYSQHADLRAVLLDSRPAGVIVSRALADKVAALLPDIGSPPVVLVSEGDTAVPGTDWEQLDTTDSDAPGSTVYPEDVANIQYTSGSTGQPKGCVLSHASWSEMARMMAEHGPRLTERDVLFTAQPFYYMDPQWNLAAAMYTGASVVVADRFHPHDFWAAVRRHGVTFFYCLGVMPSLLLKTPLSPGDRDSAVRYVACSAIPTDQHRQLEERFGCPWHELYGSTELGVVSMVEQQDHDRTVGTGGLGRPLPNREIRIVDEDGDPVPRGETGCLLVRGVHVTYGYFNDEASTSAVFRNGWYETGDLANQDGEGFLYFRGRTKDIIRRSGENISATQVEQVIEQHPRVALAACVPAPDELRGEEVKAYVVLRDAAQDSAAVSELVEFSQGELAYFKVPRYWVFRESLPLTPSREGRQAGTERPAAGRAVL